MINIIMQSGSNELELRLLLYSGSLGNKLIFNLLLQLDSIKIQGNAQYPTSTGHCSIKIILNLLLQPDSGSNDNS